MEIHQSLIQNALGNKVVGLHLNVLVIECDGATNRGQHLLQRFPTKNKQDHVEQKGTS